MISTFTRQNEIWAQHVWLNLTLRFPVLKPRTARSQILEVVKNSIWEDFPPNWKWDDLSLLEHSADQACYELKAFNQFLRLSRDNLDPRLGDLGRVPDMVYCIARLRSRIQKCCWVKAGMKEYLSIAQLYLYETDRVWEGIDLATSAWLYRGELGRSEIQMLSVSGL